MSISSSSFYHFGELLKTFRKRRHLTQQQIAAAVGVHRNAVGRWERGDFLPDSRGIVLELARLLRLEEHETRQLLEASLTALTPHWSIPYLRNPFFTGRDEILDMLHAYLNPDQAIVSAQPYAIYGLAGSGKTQIAVEYAYRYNLEYNAVFWINAEAIENIISGFLNIAELLKLPKSQEADQMQVVAAVQHWLNVHKGWLLIWDNVEDLELLQRFLPRARQGASLITTQRQALGTLAQGLELTTMAPEEGILFLLRRAKLLSSQATSKQVYQFAQRMPAEYQAAERLWTLMGGLPLALDQAGSYIDETGCGLSDYLQRYENQRAQL